MQPFQDLSNNDKILFIVFKIFLHLLERKNVFLKNYIIFSTNYMDQQGKC